MSKTRKYFVAITLVAGLTSRCLVAAQSTCAFAHTIRHKSKVRTILCIGMKRR